MLFCGHGRVRDRTVCILSLQTFGYSPFANNKLTWLDQLWYIPGVAR